MISRRRFLQLSGMTAAGLIIPKRLEGLTCDQSTADVMGLGPYWEPYSPFRSYLASQNEPGTRLILTGVVTANDWARSFTQRMLIVQPYKSIATYSCEHFWNCTCFTCD